MYTFPTNIDKKQSTQFQHSMAIQYRKRNTQSLFENFNHVSSNQIENIQNYLPIYDTFFVCNSSNYNNITFDQSIYLKAIQKQNHDNVFNAILSDDTEKDIFVKYSSIINPLYYMVGKYKSFEDELFNLPTFEGEYVIKESKSTYNVGYIDSFFTFLSTKMSEKYTSPHNIIYYDSFLCNKTNYVYDVEDDIPNVETSHYFHSMYGSKFKFKRSENKRILNCTQNICRSKLKQDYKEGQYIQLDDTYESIHEFKRMYDGIFEESSYTNQDVDVDRDIEMVYENNNIVKNKDIELCYDNDKNTDTDTDSNECEHDDEDDDEDNSDMSDSTTDFDEEENSENSHDIEDNNSDSEYTNDNEGDNDSESDNESESDSDSDDYYHIIIDKQPSLMICMEKLEETLDSYMQRKNVDISDEEWVSILAQIIFNLIGYQKVFDFTHNDLHTNNIMYETTNKTYILYTFDGKIYKIPTYGKIFKIIDFGRSIFKYGDKRYCSNSFKQRIGDASSQYNCEPFFRPHKKRIEPNPSFDLSRLACSLYEFFMNIPINVYDKDIFRFIQQMCMDDDGKNIGYKSNMEERFEGFLLYKMIARKVHCQVPSKVIQHEIFQPYCIGTRFDEEIKKDKTLFENKKHTHMNIDDMTPEFY